jgi:hypothetical protein
MEWPPVIKNGRLGYVDGKEAAGVIILMTVSDLSQNPFNSEDLSLGDITFRVQSSNRSRIENALRRLSPIISIEAIHETRGEDGSDEYQVIYVDRESRAQGSIRVT